MIPFEFQKRIANFKIDLFLPAHNLAIEIDEHAHSDRDVAYEGIREQRIREELGCKFIRINPDAADFKLSSCIGSIMFAILEHDNRASMLPSSAPEESVEQIAEEAKPRKRRRAAPRNLKN